MQRKLNKYQRDKRCHIIKAPKDQEVEKLKGKNKEEIMVTKNKFDALEIKGIEKPTLRITDGKENSNDEVKEKIQQAKEYQKVKEKIQQENAQISSSHHKKNRNDNLTVLKQE